MLVDSRVQRCFGHVPEFSAINGSKVWALQEYALAQRTTFLWGKDSADGRKLADIFKRVWPVIVQDGWMAVLSREDTAKIREALLGFLYFEWVRGKYQLGPLDAEIFAGILATAQELQVTDPRDKVFGLLFLAPPELANAVRPDYSTSAQEVYRKLAVAMSLVARVEAIFKDIERDYLANIPVLLAPRWLPSWMDELSLRISELLQANSMSGDVYSEAITECLDISSKNWYKHGEPEPRNANEGLHLLSERGAYRESLT